MQCDRAAEEKKLRQKLEEKETERKRMLQHAQALSSSSQYPELAQEKDDWVRYVNQRFERQTLSLQEKLDALRATAATASRTNAKEQRKWTLKQRKKKNTQSNLGLSESESDENALGLGDESDSDSESQELGGGHIGG